MVGSNQSYVDTIQIQKIKNRLTSNYSVSCKCHTILGFRMKAEYDLSKMQSRKNPYASKLKKPVTIRLG